MHKVEIKNKKVNICKLLSFGFEEQNDGYIYAAELAGSGMKMTVTVSRDGCLFTRVTDGGSGEEYVLHLVAGAAGAFVGQVRAGYDAVLGSIISACFDPDVFKSRQALSIIGYIREKYRDEPEFLWEKFPNNAIWRRADNRKWYAALLTVSGRKLGLDRDDIMEIIDLRMNPEAVPETVDNVKYFPGYHMNKKHWITICLDGTVSDEELQARVDASFALAKK